MMSPRRAQGDSFRTSFMGTFETGDCPVGAFPFSDGTSTDRGRYDHEAGTIVGNIGAGFSAEIFNFTRRDSGVLLAHYGAAALRSDGTPGSRRSQTNIEMYTNGLVHTPMTVNAIM